jgi:broad specificity phosphatase PhoE
MAVCQDKKGHLERINQSRYRISMPRIFLIRHGHVGAIESVFNGPEVPLSERGERQIQALVEDFQATGITPNKIIASPFTRTQSSAAILSSAFGFPVETNKDLEEWRVGAWFGKPLKDFYAYTQYDKYPDIPLPPDIEPLETCAKRVQGVLSRIIQNASPDETIFVVSHREPMVSAILGYQGQGWDSIHAIHFPFASVWELTFERSEQPSSLEKRFDRSTLI